LVAGLTLTVMTDLEAPARAVVARESEMAVGSMKLARVDGQRICLVRTATGFHALDNACPHEGYGLVTGALDGELLTCEWHNWKFDVSDGSCVLGEEAVACHEVTLDGDEVVVTVRRPSPAQARDAAWASLDRGIDQQYDGQIARDSLRLIQAGAAPLDIIWRAVARTSPRTEEGFNHALAMTADCITALEGFTGDDRLIPVAQAVSALAESELRRPERPRRPPTAGGTFEEYQRLVETEQADAADAMLTGALLDGLSRQEAARWLIAPTCAHHISFGHGAIYTQKAFEMLDAVGWQHAPELLGHLTMMHVLSTREDKLPYMRPFLRALDAGDLGSRWRAPVDPSWAGRDELVEVLLGSDLVAGASAAQRALDEGAGVRGLLDAVSIAASERMLRHDLQHESRPDVSGYNWLDITHSLTYANAARWAWDNDPGEHTARLAMYTVFHVIDGGRYATSSVPAPAVDPHRSLDDALRSGDPQGAVAAAFAEPLDRVGDTLVRASLDDRSGALIVVAHHVKVVRAAIAEARATGSRRPLAAAARFLAAPAKQRFVANAVDRARHFLTTGAPPPR
jgi:nitrite reductase/ring-hydroxylating ferredoxin subunit